MLSAHWTFTNGNYATGIGTITTSQTNDLIVVVWQGHGAGGGTPTVQGSSLGTFTYNLGGLNGAFCCGGGYGVASTVATAALTAETIKFDASGFLNGSYGGVGVFAVHGASILGTSADWDANGPWTPATALTEITNIAPAFGHTMITGFTEGNAGNITGAGTSVAYTAIGSFPAPTGDTMVQASPQVTGAGPFSFDNTTSPPGGNYANGSFAHAIKRAC
jgi:hypothetical protein